MATFTCNGLEFTLERDRRGWAIRRGAAVMAVGLFPDLAESQALARARDLARIIHPAGVRLVGPDVDHPQRIGDLRLVGPDVTHPNFIHWTKDSAGAN